MESKVLARYIDHTNLRPQAHEADIIKLCHEAVEYSFATVCVAPFWVQTAHKLLSGTDTRVCTVVGFPLGYNSTSIKGQEAAEAVASGAMEIDMVIPLGPLTQGSEATVGEDIRHVVECTKAGNDQALVKVIIECCYLTDEQKVLACKLAEEAGADFVKTSTGFGLSGATKADVFLMRSAVSSKVGVKAAGGIRTAGQALEMIRAGANRIGTSNGVGIVEALK